jgi:hypothetical protein
MAGSASNPNLMMNPQMAPSIGGGKQLGQMASQKLMPYKEPNPAQFIGGHFMQTPSLYQGAGPLRTGVMNPR